MPEPKIWPVGHRFTDSDGAERVKTRWEFNAFVTQEGARASAVNLGQRGTTWYIWRLEDGSYDHSAVPDPATPGHPAELVETLTVKAGATRDPRARITCRRCGAQPGQQCVTSSGTRAPMVHAERRNDSRRAEGQTAGLEQEGMYMDRFPPSPRG